MKSIKQSIDAIENRDGVWFPTDPGRARWCAMILHAATVLQFVSEEMKEAQTSPGIIFDLFARAKEEQEDTKTFRSNPEIRRYVQEHKDGIKGLKSASDSLHKIWLPNKKEPKL